MLTRYDSNFIQFNDLPNLRQFKEAAHYLRDYHRKYGQKHEKFYLPANTVPTVTLTDYFQNIGYDFGYNELYAIEPHQFPLVKNESDIEVVEVTHENFETFVQLQFPQDLEFGREFAEQKIELHKRNFQERHILQVLAFYKGTAAGSMDVIVAEETVEIDNLSIAEMFQKKGIGSRLQRFVMDQFSDKTVILVADGEDTPREMYQRQNYQCLGYKYEVQKIDQD
ncbi:GNAT family N-acetyltransferase [Halobacillus seohaensis]|uniref:GNAT family N-acetyltransferase n=1 Tax=Halobacillus seohaensis TaxID=447421 RepID=A0ABW2EMS6_9BACI